MWIDRPVPPPRAVWLVPDAISYRAPGDSLVLGYSRGVLTQQGERYPRPTAGLDGGQGSWQGTKGGLVSRWPGGLVLQNQSAPGRWLRSGRGEKAGSLRRSPAPVGVRLATSRQ